MSAMTREPAGSRAGASAWLFLLGLVAAAILAVDALDGVPKGAQMWPWALGRASGLLGYLLISVTVLLGIWQSHPWSRRHPVVSVALAARLHSLLTVFSLCFVVVHVLSLAADPYAQVGWVGAVVPGASVYRPLPVALGTLALYAGLLTGLSAALGPWIGRRLWLPLHRWSAVVLGLIWFHAVLAGSDTPQLRGFYIVSGAMVVLFAASRYLAAAGGRPAREGGTPG